MVIGSTYACYGSAYLYRKNKKTTVSEVIASSLVESDIPKNQLSRIAKTPLDISWLPLAAKQYEISSDINDYVIVGVPIVTSDYPNRNLQSMSKNELLSFAPRFGRVTYKTFTGKPCHQDHDNSDIKKAKGVNFDAITAYIPEYNVFKIIVLSGFDRTKDKELAKAIESKERRFYSMGAWVEQFLCSVCNMDAGIPTCSHFKRIGKGNIDHGKLIYQKCVGIDFFENSSVESPADVTATGEDIIIMGN